MNSRSLSICNYIRFQRHFDRFKPFKLKLFLIALSAALVVQAVHFPARALAAAPATSSQTQAPSKLERQVKEWVASLAEQKPFKAWQSADPQIEALGPGTHSWLVLFTKEGKDIGYMVVHAVMDGSFQLGEYGVGPHSLFSPQVLKRSLIDGGLMTADQAQRMTAVKHYVHPFAAAWEVKIDEDTYWLDAKTAEQLPVDNAAWNRMFSPDKPFFQGPPTGSRLVAHRLNEPFDAYEKLPWLTKEAPFPANATANVQKRLDGKQHLRYVTEPFGDAMLYAVPIIGYQRWSNGRMDLAIDMEGTRYVPIGALLRQGLFYR
ncbi:hypothetical protein D7Z26_13635 [Cohnella endophytica]|uniref:Uncharacterized protein n=1 Tax=Cohnella endophytica TaxID=2419778 RepID=A0A494XUY1_9BACL|nr:hypothetical protein [Cohnella endophytica]RKP54390.1 hypothetical protein D7Z26_13635 [Cohnella endophytica]